MENLFLEILRMIDYKFNNKIDKLISSDYYLISYNYYKLILSKEDIILEDLIKIIRESNGKCSKSLFSLSKIDKDKNILDGVDFNNPEFGFYKSRDIIFYISVYLKYLVNDNNFKNLKTFEVEKKFFNNNIEDKNIDYFFKVLNICNESNSKIDMYNKMKELDSLFIEDLSYKMLDNDNNLENYIKNSIYILLSNNSFEQGIKETLYTNFETSVLYLMFSMLTFNLNQIKLSRVYSNIENSYK